MAGPKQLDDGHDDLRTAQALVQALRNPRCYPHPVDTVEVLETHISWVLLAGGFAYKIKKPVRLPFLDFSTRERRHRFCLEELRVNRRLAPELYLDVVPIVMIGGRPVMGGDGIGLEHAVRMARFDTDRQLDALAVAGRLEPEHVLAAARAAARFHGRAGVAEPGGRFATPAQLRAEAMDNFDALDALADAAAYRDTARRLREWTLDSLATHADRFVARLAQGAVRECHGDMHLANMAWWHDDVVIFDAIEFDEALRWIDVMSEIAFALMDLHHRGRPELASVFLNGYLEITGDYEGLVLLPHYLVYRALVRAKVSGFRASGLSGEARRRAGADLGAHLALAMRLAEGLERPTLTITHGVSGSGKSWLSARLAAHMGAVRLRSDVERARIFPAGSTGNVGAQRYGGAASERVYARLAELATQALAAGFPVIVDATFLEARRRNEFATLAHRIGVPFAILACTAGRAALEERVVRRIAAGTDASEATPEVLAAQISQVQPLDAAEAAAAVHVDTSGVVNPGAVAAALRALNAARPEAGAGELLPRRC